MRREVAAALALGTLACRGELSADEVAARAEFVTMPAVRCIRITTVGATRTVSHDFNVPATGAAHSVALRGLPTGDVLVFGTAFDVACAELASRHPTWVAETVRQTLGGGAISTITLVFHPNGEATVTADFGGAASFPPAGASCLRVRAIGATRTVERNLEVGAATFALSDLPAGDVLFLADAFAVPCSSVAEAAARSWEGTPVHATLTAGVPGSVTIELHLLIVIAVSISPQVAFSAPGRTVAFSARVNGGTSVQSTAVTWSVQEIGGGSVDSAGAYTAPAAAGTYHVVATSVADPY